jgi:hypothetical protein
MKLSLVNLAPLKEIDVNDPALMRSRAAKDQMGKSKPNPRIGFDQALDLRGEKQDLEQQISNLYREMETDPDVEAEGGPVADQYGDTLNRLETRLYKINKEIASYDMSEGQKIGNTSYKTRTAINTAPGKTEDKEVMIDNTDDLNNVTIRWRGANHHGNKTLTNLKFTKESEFDEDLMAFSNDSKWLFIVDLDEETGEPDWDTLMVDNRELENVADDGTSTYSVPPEDMINETTEKAWNALDVSRKAEKEIDNKEWNSRTTKKLDMLKSLNTAGKFKKDWGEEKLQGWVDQNYSWEKLARQFKLNESYNNLNVSNVLSVSETMQDEGSCGYGPDGVPGDTPGETRGMPADTRTMTMMREVIKKEIKKLSEADPKAIKGKHYPDEETVKNLKKGPYSPGGQNAQQENLEDKLKGAFSPEEMDKINSKQVPSFADMKPKEKKSKFKKAGEKSGFDMRGLK